MLDAKMTRLGQHTVIWHRPTEAEIIRVTEGSSPQTSPAGARSTAGRGLSRVVTGGSVHCEPCLRARERARRRIELLSATLGVGLVVLGVWLLAVVW